MAEGEVRRKRSAANTGGRSLRESEDQYLKEERLRDDLDLARRQKLELEAALLDRDSRAIESKFDLEASELEVERLKRRVKELDHAYKSLSAVTQQGPAKGAFTGVGGAASKKEQDLEGVVEAMKRVVDKLKSENDRLKKSAGGGTEERRVSELERKFQAERKRVTELEEEARALQSKMKGHEESSQKIVQRQQQVAGLRRQLKSKEDELASLQAQSEGVIVERETLKKRVTTMQDRINELEISLHKQQSAARTTTPSNNSAGQQEREREAQELRRQVADQTSENDSLRLQLNDLRRSMQQLQAQAGGDRGGRGAGSEGGGAVSVAEFERVKTENAKLRSELSAFDMDFFEEIENLKYSHAEAVRKLRMYESAAAGGGGSRLGSNRT